VYQISSASPEFYIGDKNGQININIVIFFVDTVYMYILFASVDIYLYICMRVCVCIFLLLRFGEIKRIYSVSKKTNIFL